MVSQCPLWPVSSRALERHTAGCSLALCRCGLYHSQCGGSPAPAGPGGGGGERERERVSEREREIERGGKGWRVSERVSEAGAEWLYLSQNPFEGVQGDAPIATLDNWLQQITPQHFEHHDNICLQGYNQ